MFGFPTQRKYIIAPLLLACLMLILHLGEPLTIEWFGFYPERIVNGEYWRMVTGQLLHTNTNHLLLNLSGLLLVWALHGEYYQVKHFFILCLVSLALVGGSLMLFAEYYHYAGLSGILHTLFVYGGFIDIKKGDRTGWLLLAGIGGKVGYEMLIGPSKETEALIGASVAAEAHLIGVIVGAVLGITYLLRLTSKSTVKTEG
jgi:rhomboid family GlyGly-CTERM serine protease